MESISIEQITIPYDIGSLDRWKKRDPQIVPEFMLEWKGPGISNGYGFGEWMAEKYLRNQGYYIFSNDFNLISKNTKFTRINNMIETMIGKEEIDNFKRALSISIEKGYSVENVDLFVYSLDNYYFVEVKKGDDRLREPQMRFIYLAEKYLGIESKLIYLCDRSSDIRKEELSFDFEIQL